jgi:hypothetical protein
MTIIQTSTDSAIDAAARRNSKLFAAYIVVLLVTAIIIAVFTWLTWDSGNKLQDAIRNDANARIKEATKDIPTLQRAASDAKAAQQRVEIELDKQRERTAKAERELLEVQQRIELRKLSEEQQETLKAALLRIPKIPVAIQCLLGDREGCPFAEQIKQVFVSCGWDVHGVGQAVYNGNPTGLHLHLPKVNPNAAPTMDDVPPSAFPIQEAFTLIGLRMGASFMTRIPAGSIEIFVGGNPQRYK